MVCHPQTFPILEAGEKVISNLPLLAFKNEQNNIQKIAFSEVYMLRNKL